MQTPGFIDSKFRLAILAAKRAKQLVSGARKKIDITAENPLTVALQEIQLGKISFQIFDEEFKNLSADSSNDGEDILEALEGVELDDDYEEIDALKEAEGDVEETDSKEDGDDDDDDEKAEAEEDKDKKENTNKEEQEDDD